MTPRGLLSGSTERLGEGDLSLKAFFRNIKPGEKPGYPRFRDKDRYDSFIYPQLGFKLESGKLRLSKIGDIKVNLHRRIEGTIKRSTIRMTPTGKWFACFSVETDVILPPQKECPVMRIGVGLESFSMRSNGDKTENPRFFRSEEKEPARFKGSSLRPIKGL